MDGVNVVESPPHLPRRARDGHKGTYGKVLVVAGSRGMAGAAVLCGRAALRGGAGLVQVATPANVQDTVAAGCPCYTTFGIRLLADGTCADGASIDLVELAQSADVLAIGPGLGRQACVTALVRTVVAALPETPIVVDADALNALAPLADEFKNRPAPLVFTPHPGEFARLTEQPVPAEAQREERAVEFARKVGGVLLLKGAGTVVTDGEKVYRNATGNPGMATGGTGDVLTGLVAALVGQGLPAFDAAALGAWVHGRAGDLAAGDIGQTSLTATDVLEYIPRVFRELESRNPAE
jgi:ADP-dependent NAD(P)H-hydrate dehydratase